MVDGKTQLRTDPFQRDYVSQEFLLIFQENQSFDICISPAFLGQLNFKYSDPPRNHLNES